MKAIVFERPETTTRTRLSFDDTGVVHIGLSVEGAHEAWGGLNFALTADEAKVLGAAMLEWAKART